MSLENNNKIDSIVNSLSEISVSELASLVKALEEKWNVSASNISMGSQQPAQSANAGGEAKSSKVSVTLKEAGANKIAVIKVVREITGLGLKEAKDLVDACGLIKSDITQDEADQIKSKISEAGASVEIK